MLDFLLILRNKSFKETLIITFDSKKYIQMFFALKKSQIIKI